MTLLSDSTPRTRTDASHLSTDAPRPWRPSTLLRPVMAAIARLDDGESAVDVTVRRRIDQMLREALDGRGERPDDADAAAVPAVRVACAHLAAGDLEDAYLALLTARDLAR